MPTAKNVTMHCTRAKCFVHTGPGGGTVKHLVQPAPKPQTAPMWIVETQTYKDGIKDGSITCLTPPHLLPGYKPEVEEVVEEPAVVPETKPTEPEAEVVQTAVPEGPFGGQPLTPVPPAPRVGGVTANTKRSK